MDSVLRDLPSHKEVTKVASVDHTHAGSSVSRGITIVSSGSVRSTATGEGPAPDHGRVLTVLCNL